INSRLQGDGAANHATVGQWPQAADCYARGGGRRLRRLGGNLAGQGAGCGRGRRLLLSLQVEGNPSMLAKKLHVQGDRGQMGLKCPLRFAPCMPEPERVVGLGFRYWMLGLSNGDIGSWEKAWCLYSGLFGAASARIAVEHLGSWVGALGSATRRDIEVF